MSFMDPKTLFKELDAALIFFDALNFEEDVKSVVLDQITGAIIMVESSLAISSEEIRTKQLETVRDMVQNLQLFKIAETGSDFSGMVFCAAK